MPKKKTGKYIKCLTCKKEFYVRKYRKDVAKFCSRKCHHIKSIGIHRSPETEFKKGDNVGKDNNNWKGDNVGYMSVHEWINKKRGKANICEHCGAIKNKKRFVWANKDHTYKRKLDDYISLCNSCHIKYDVKYNDRNVGCKKRLEE